MGVRFLAFAELPRVSRWRFCLRSLSAHMGIVGFGRLGFPFFDFNHFFNVPSEVVLRFSQDEVSLELLQRFRRVDHVRTREKGIGAESKWVAVFHRVPVGHMDVAAEERLLQARFAREMTFAPVLIDQTLRL